MPHSEHCLIHCIWWCLIICCLPCLSWRYNDRRTLFLINFFLYLGSNSQLHTCKAGSYNAELNPWHSSIFIDSLLTEIATISSVTPVYFMECLLKHSKYLNSQFFNHNFLTVYCFEAHIWLSPKRYLHYKTSLHVDFFYSKLKGIRGKVSYVQEHFSHSEKKWVTKCSFEPLLQWHCLLPLPSESKHLKSKVCTKSPGVCTILFRKHILVSSVFY